MRAILPWCPGPVSSPVAYCGPSFPPNATKPKKDSISCPLSFNVASKQADRGTAQAAVEGLTRLVLHVTPPCHKGNQLHLAAISYHKK